MPDQKTKSLFISHSWNQNQREWKRVTEWLESEPGLSWRNCSRPDMSALPNTSSQTLAKEMSRQIASAEAVILLSEMYVESSTWLDYEIKEAMRMNKFIIGMTPLERGSVPMKIKGASDFMVGGHRASLIGMVKCMV